MLFIRCVVGFPIVFRWGTDCLFSAFPCFAYRFLIIPAIRRLASFALSAIALYVTSSESALAMILSTAAMMSALGRSVLGLQH